LRQYRVFLQVNKVAGITCAIPDELAAAVELRLQGKTGSRNPSEIVERNLREAPANGRVEFILKVEQNLPVIPDRWLHCGEL
jgi:hypothetical protein